MNENGTKIRETIFKKILILSQKRERMQKSIGAMFL